MIQRVAVVRAMCVSIRSRGHAMLACEKAMMLPDFCKIPNRVFSVLLTCPGRPGRTARHRSIRSGRIDKRHFPQAMAREAPGFYPDFIMGQPVAFFTPSCFTTGFASSRLIHIKANPLTLKQNDSTSTTDMHCVGINFERDSQKRDSPERS